MKHHWLIPWRNALMGKDPVMRRHVFFVLLTLIPYVVTASVITQSAHLGLMRHDTALQLNLMSAAIFTGMFVLVRSGWSRRFHDPVLTFPHALLGLCGCVLAYTQLGDHRGNVMILMAQTIVLSMFRLQPVQVLQLGLFNTALLACAVVGLSLSDPVHYPFSLGLAHFLVGGSTLLTLSLIGKWVSDIRVRIARQAKELSEAVHTVQQMATTDMLTGALNRRVMADLAEAELRLSERSGTAMCVALIDLDHFKHVNDQHGHHVGDLVLRTFAQSAQAQLRRVDKLARWGGEEFLLMLPHANEQDSLAALERLRQALETQAFEGHGQLRVTLSAGIARPTPGESLEHLIERADMALYAAKRQGRNRCLLADGAPPPSQPQTTSEQVLP